jgi:hypothetical protein
MPLVGQKLRLSRAERIRRAQRANHARKFVDRKKQAEAVRKVGLMNTGATPEICSKGGSTSRDLGVGVHGMSSRELSEVGIRGGKIGGKIQGPENARIGWMGHILLIRYEKSHEKCRYCINQKSGTEKL